MADDNTRKADLTQSGQLSGEVAAMAVSKAHVFGHRFPVENSRTRCQLAAC